MPRTFSLALAALGVISAGGAAADEKRFPPVIGSPPLSAALRMIASRYVTHLKTQITAQIEPAGVPAGTGPPHDRKHDRAHVRVKLSPTGQLLSRSILVSSGDAAVDAVMLAAVDRAQPFAPPPEAISTLREGIIIALMLPDASANLLQPKSADKSVDKSGEK